MREYDVEMTQTFRIEGVKWDDVVTRARNYMKGSEPADGFGKTVSDAKLVSVKQASKRYKVTRSFTVNKIYEVRAANESEAVKKIRGVIDGYTKSKHIYCGQIECPPFTIVAEEIIE